MAGRKGYQEWIAGFQRNSPSVENYSFLDNYWCALLSIAMEEQKIDQFNIPYFILEEELKKEDGNVNMEEDSKTIKSQVLTHLLVHLLKQFKEETNLTNYESSLHDFLNQDAVLPPGIANPLTPSTSFHCLPTECKLWILCALIGREKPFKSPSPFHTDQERNCFYLIAPCRLYVQIAGENEANSPFDDDHLNGKAWGSLCRHVSRKQFKLLSENRTEWDVMWKALQRLNIPNVVNGIRNTVEMRLIKTNSLSGQRDRERSDFTRFLSTLPPIPKMRSKGKKNKSSPSLDSIAMHSKPVDSSDGATNLQDQRAQEEFVEKTQKRCRRFPQCRLGSCKDTHPYKACPNFPNCPGVRCKYLHPDCANDGRCVDIDCSYEHRKSQPTLCRKRNEDKQVAVNTHENKMVTTGIEKNRNTPNTNSDGNSKSQEGPTRCKHENEVLKIAMDEMSINSSNYKVAKPEHERKRSSSIVSTKRMSADKTNENKAPRDGAVRARCQFFPQCKKSSEECNFIHPTNECKKVKAGDECTRFCFCLHGPCPNDGSCQDDGCIYEHHDSKPIIMRSKNHTGGLRRSDSQISLGNISVMSASTTTRATSNKNSPVVRSGRKPSDDQSTVSSAANKEAKTLRDSTKNYRCLHFPQCKVSAANCKYFHPQDPCKKVKAGDKCNRFCLFLHGPCPNDGDCQDDGCYYEHNSSKPIVMRRKNNTAPREGAVRARCQFFPQCKKSSEECNFIHPTNECKKVKAGDKCTRFCFCLHGPCPNDGSCQDDGCIYEHYDSKPIIMRSKNHTGGLRRSDSQISLGNISVISASTTTRATSNKNSPVVRSGRKPSDDQSTVSSAANKESGMRRSTSQESLGNVSVVSTASRVNTRSSTARTGQNQCRSSHDESIASLAVGTDKNRKKRQSRCRFYPGCKKGEEECGFTHPMQPCKAFPNCPRGGGCPYLHDLCPKDGVCCNDRCTYEHKEYRELSDSWCDNGSYCKRNGCWHLHPEECTGTCPTPGNCWKYHQRSPTPLSGGHHNSNPPSIPTTPPFRGPGYPMGPMGPVHVPFPGPVPQHFAGPVQPHLVGHPFYYGQMMPGPMGPLIGHPMSPAMGPPVGPAPPGYYE